MSTTPLLSRAPFSAAGALPARMRILHVTASGRSEKWLTDALSFDSATEVELHESHGGAAAMETLREEVFDAVLVSHRAEHFDAIEFVAGLRAGGAEEPIVVLGVDEEYELAPLCYEAGGDGYLCIHGTTVRMFLWTLARAVERHQLLRENGRLMQGERQRLRHEHQEADRLLSQQRALIADLESLHPSDETVPLAENSSELITDSQHHREETIARLAEPRLNETETCDLPPRLVAHYRELLRAHVIMGFGNLASEMSQLAEMLATAGVTAPRMMLLHLRVLEELVRGLGTRSARHVMSRADLLVLEVMIHLAEDYRRRAGVDVAPSNAK